ncbi:probable conserved secreted protein TB22.2 [Mycobacterium sp. MFM001]|uniref:esterase n=1 Tax=Mycobacterium sp. MFM001 TaxID=2049453 RepID=UPI000DA4C4FC|nr:esterase [Mycobacterium sp. MFM001]GBE66319.1 probable conserved secreted protein TB22.2 [Mycobacterium sp. MFM001]
MRTVIAAALLAAGALVGWPAGPLAVADPSCAGMGGSVESGQTCHVHTSNATYTLDMKFPVDYPDQQALTDYLTQNRDGFVNVAQTSGPRDQPYQMEVTSEQYHSGKPPKGTQSVVLKVFEDLGGPRPSTFYKGFNYDLDKRQPITFDTLFAPNSKPLDAIYPIVQRELGRQTGLGGAIPPGTGLDSSHYQNFAITDDSLIFYFAPGELLPPFAGPAQAQVPRNAIPPLAV